MEPENIDSLPQLTGFVIITLPPPDNPSIGKTITAFTLTDHHSSTPHQINQTHNAPIQAQNLNRRSSPLRNFLHRSSRAILPILSISLIAFYVWTSISRESVFELRDENGRDKDDDRDRNSTQQTFVFPLYRKGRGIEFEGNLIGEVELKLGKFVRKSSDAKSVSDSLKIDAASVVPVRGNVYPDGLYYTFLHFGNPPKPYFLDVDTGSDLTWIQCDAPCTSCAKGAHPFYKPLKANIIAPVDSFCVEVQGKGRNKDCDPCHQCDYEIEYADHSSSMGVLARDELNLNVANGTLAKSKVVFGCAYDQRGLLLNTLGKTDGILGLSRAKISLPSQLVSQGIINNVVGHCLAASNRGGGYLFFGDDFVPYRKMTWVPMLHTHASSSYQTEIIKMSYGSKQIRLGNIETGQGRLVFDTGSSYSYFTEQAYNELITMLNDISSESLTRDTSDNTLPICWRAESRIRSVKDVRHLFKPLNLQFGSKWWIVSTTLQIPPEGYLITNSKGNVCLCILNGRKVHDGSTFILGDISLRGFLFAYDNVKEKIGWIRSDCERAERFETHSLY